MASKTSTMACCCIAEFAPSSCHQFSPACNDFYTQVAQELTPWQGACSTAALQLSASTCLQMEVDQADIADRYNAAPLPDVDSIPEAVNLARADPPVTHATSTGDKTCALNVHMIGIRKKCVSSHSFWVCNTDLSPKATLKLRSHRAKCLIQLLMTSWQCLLDSQTASRA